MTIYCLIIYKMFDLSQAKDILTRNRGEISLHSLAAPCKILIASTKKSATPQCNFANKPPVFPFS